jgi:hypothetical protein
MPLDPKEFATDVTTRHRLQSISLVPFGDITLSHSGNYVVKGVIPDESLVVIWGPPKCGKSFFASDMALHVALDWPWRGRRVKSGAVVYLAAEGAHGFKSRIAAFRQERLSESNTRVPFYLVPTTLDLIGQRTSLIAAIRESLGSATPVMVVLDTLNRTLRGSESNDKDMSDYIKAADAIRETFACAVVVIHHCGIEASRPRGHTSLSGAVDAQIAVKKSTDGIFTATVELMKDGQEGEMFGNRLRVVEVGQDEDGDAITSCIVEEAETTAPERKVRLSARQRRGLEVLNDCIIEKGEPSPGGQHYPSKARVVSVELWRECLFKTGVLDRGASNPRTDFKRIKDSLADRGAVREWDGRIWNTNHDNEA